jgi:hypothetical protein
VGEGGVWTTIGSRMDSLRDCGGRYLSAFAAKDVRFHRQYAMREAAIQHRDRLARAGGAMASKSFDDPCSPS